MAISLKKLQLLLLSLSLLLLFSSATPSPPSSSAAAAQALKSHGGYHLSSTFLTATSGTILAPPDSSFSLLLSPNRLRPSSSLLLRHSLRQRLTWQDLNTPDGSRSYPTWQPDRCLFISSKNSISGDANSISAVRIRHPNIYVDDHLTVHGIDGAIDPTSISQCSDPTAEIVSRSRTDTSSFLDLAVKALRRKGFSVAAAALSLNRRYLINLTSVTVFATSDESLFSSTDGFRYDFLHHVVPKRHRLEQVVSLSSIQTLSPNKTIRGEIAAVGASEIYHNSWIVVISVPRSLDDSGKFPATNPRELSGGVYGEEDTAAEGEAPCPTANKCPSADVEESEPSVAVSEKLEVQSAPSHGSNRVSERVGEFVPLDDDGARRLSEASTADISRRFLSSWGESGVAGRTGDGHVVELADDLFYYS